MSLADVVERQAGYIEQLRAVQSEAYWLLAWTHQNFLEFDANDRAKGLEALNKNRDHLNTSEQNLLDALLAASVNGTGDSDA